MIINYPCNVSKENLRILIKEYDFNTGKKENYHLNPKDIDDLILTKNSSVSTAIFQLKPDLNILIFHKGKLTNLISQVNNLPKIFKNEELFIRLSRYKRRKLMWLFCKAVCSGRVKVLSRLNETRENKIVDEVLIEMRQLDRKLIKAKSREELMGIEGNIAKDFYFALSEFNSLFDVRRDRFGKDIVNSLMNYAHTILRNRIYQRLILNGINPYHSFLHNKQDRNETSLTFDFAEFWIAYVDKLIFYSLEKGIIKEKDMNKDRLKSKAAIKIVDLINKRITNEEIDNKIKEFIGYLKGKNRLSWKI